MAMNEDGARRAAYVFLAAGVVLLAVNHWNVMDQHRAFLWAVLIGPTALFLGVAGVINPKIVLAAGKYGKDLPSSLKAIAVILVVAGLACSALLALVVYQLR